MLLEATRRLNSGIERNREPELRFFHKLSDLRFSARLSLS